MNVLLPKKEYITFSLKQTANLCGRYGWLKAGMSNFIQKVKVRIHSAGYGPEVRSVTNFFVMIMIKLITVHCPVSHLLMTSSIIDG